MSNQRNRGLSPVVLSLGLTIDEARHSMSPTNTIQGGSVPHIPQPLSPKRARIQVSSRCALALLFAAAVLLAFVTPSLHAKEPATPAPLPIEQMQDACALTKLPLTGVYRYSQMEGAFVTAHYPDPRQLPKDYTGCIQIWMEAKERSEPFIVGRFVGGDVHTIRIPAMNIECAYTNGKLSKTGGPNERRCPPTTEGMELKTWQK